jgi:flagellar biogenesis protein FliO
MGSYLVSTTLALIAVCGIAVLALRALKPGGLGRAKGGIKLLGSLPLETRRSVYLIEAGGRCFLVGGGDAGLSVLAELDASAVAHEQAVAPARGIWAQALARMFSKTGQA